MFVVEFFQSQSVKTINNGISDSTRWRIENLARETSADECPILISLCNIFYGFDKEWKESQGSNFVIVDLRNGIRSDLT